MKANSSPQSESTLQQQIIEHFTLIRTKYNFVFFAPMNEGVMMVLKMFKIPDSTCARIMNFMKKMGFLPGVSDIIIMHNGKAYCMELKTYKGVQSDAQKLFMKNVLLCGIDYAVVRSFEDAVECMRIWGIVI